MSPSPDRPCWASSEASIRVAVEMLTQSGLSVREVRAAQVAAVAIARENGTSALDEFRDLAHLARVLERRGERVTPASLGL